MFYTINTGNASVRYIGYSVRYIEYDFHLAIIFYYIKIADDAQYGRSERGKKTNRGFELCRHRVKADRLVVWRCSKCRVLKCKAIIEIGVYIWLEQEMWCTITRVTHLDLQHWPEGQWKS